MAAKKSKSAQGKSNRRRGLGYQGQVKKKIREITGAKVITHSTEWADIYIDDPAYPFVIECKNIGDFSVAQFFTVKWIKEVLFKIHYEGIQIHKTGLLIIKGNNTGSWVCYPKQERHIVMSILSQLNPGRRPIKEFKSWIITPHLEAFAYEEFLTLLTIDERAQNGSQQVV